MWELFTFVVVVMWELFTNSIAITNNSSMNHVPGRDS